MGIIKSSLIAMVSSGDGGTPPSLGSIEATSNRDYHASDYGLDGFSSVTANVPTPSYPLGRLDVVSDELKTYNPSDYHLYAFDVVCVNIHGDELGVTSVQSGSLCKAVVRQGRDQSAVILEELFSFTPQTPASTITGAVSVQNRDTGYYWYGYTYRYNGSWVTAGYTNGQLDGSLNGTCTYLDGKHQPRGKSWRLFWNNIT